MSEHHLLLYEYVEGMRERRIPYREAHLARIHVEQEAGRILMAGGLGDPPTAGAMVWKGATREQIEAFVAGEPYLEPGLITSYRIEPWALV